MSTDAAREIDARFYRAIIIGLSAGIPSAFVVLTLLFSAFTTTGWVMAASYSALPAIVVGPFLGGLVSTTIMSGHVGDEDDAVEPAHAAPPVAEARRAA